MSNNLKNIMGFLGKIIAVFTFVIGLYGIAPIQTSISEGIQSPYAPLLVRAHNVSWENGCQNKPKELEHDHLACTLSSSDITIHEGDVATINAIINLKDIRGIPNPIPVFVDHNVGTLQTSPLTGYIHRSAQFQVSPSITTTYTMTLDHRGSTVTCAQTINVIPANTTPTCDITATPSNVAYNGATTIAWNSTHSTSIKINGVTKALSGSMVVNNLTSDTTYTCNAIDADGDTDTDSATVTVGNAPVNTQPTCNITISPDIVDYGSNATVSWTVTDATSLHISNIGYVTVGSGSRTIYGLTTDRTFTCTARDDDGDIDIDSDTVDVRAQQTTSPTCDVRVSPTRVDEGDDYRVYWESNNATSMYITGIGYVDANEDDSKRFYNATTDRTFKCTARNDDGDQDTDTARLRVDEERNTDPEPQCTISANDTSVESGNSVTISWTSRYSDTVHLSGVGNVSRNGSHTFNNLHNTKTYTLRVDNQEGSKTCRETIGVYAATTPTYTPPTYTPPTYVPPVVIPTYIPAPVVTPPVVYTPPRVVPRQQVALSNVPYTGAEDYLYPMFLLVLMLTAGYTFTQRRYIFA